MSEPLWLRTARAQVGTTEAPGPKSNPKILQWAKGVGRALGVGYDNDDTPWCGLFVAMCVQSANYQPPGIAIRARSWALWGEKLEAPCLGAVLVFEREGGGHVGFYTGERFDAYRVLGGNQGNRVCETWIAKNRCIAVRWPHGAPKTEAVRVAGGGGPLSLNEA